MRWIAQAGLDDQFQDVDGVDQRGGAQAARSGDAVVHVCTARLAPRNPHLSHAADCGPLWSSRLVPQTQET
jgi:hypothetical protein